MLTNVEQQPDGFPFWPVITSTRGDGRLLYCALLSNFLLYCALLSNFHTMPQTLPMKGRSGQQISFFVSLKVDMIRWVQLQRTKSDSKTCESCPTKVIWEVKVKCQFCPWWPRPGRTWRPWWPWWPWLPWCPWWQLLKDRIYPRTEPQTPLCSKPVWFHWVSQTLIISYNQISKS